MDKYTWGLKCPIRRKYSPKADFSTPGHCHGVCTCYEGERAMKQLKRKLHSTSNCKNIPEFSVICCHSGFSGLLKTRVKQPPCNVLFRGGAEETIRVRVSRSGFPQKPARASASAKHLQNKEIRTQTLLLLYTAWGTGPHTETSLNLKIVKTPSKQWFAQHSVTESLTA